MKLWRKNARFWNALESERQGKHITHQGKRWKGVSKFNKEEREQYVSFSEEGSQQEQPSSV